MLQFDQLSYWEKETYLLNIDHVIIGSGIVGLSTAIYLKKANPKKKVCVLERGYLPTGASTKNAGFACIGSASELLDDLDRDGESVVFETVQNRWKGLADLREMLGDKVIDFQANGSYELFGQKEKEVHESCKDQLNYLNEKLKSITGIKKVYSRDERIINNSNFIGFRGAIANAAEGQIDTGKMMRSLKAYAEFLGVQILYGIEVQSIEKNQLLTNFGKLNFNTVAICTNGMAKHFLSDEDLQPARAQVVVTSPISNLAFKGIYHFDKGYYYFRNIGNRVLFGGGRNQDFEGEETDELNTSDYIINHLSTLLETQVLPQAAFTIEQQWAGTMGVGKHKTPIIKKVDESIYCGVRMGGMGIAIGTSVGKRLANLMG